MLREHLIVDHLRQQDMLEALKFRALEHCVISAGQLGSDLEYNHNKIVDASRRTVRDLEDTAFPWLKKERVDKIITTEELKDIKARLKIKQEAYNAKHRQPSS